MPYAYDKNNQYREASEGLPQKVNLSFTTYQLCDLRQVT